MTLQTTGFQPHGKNLIAGDWVAGDATFSSAPSTGPSHVFTDGSVELVDRAVQAAEEAFWSYGYASREERAAFLSAIADEIEARAEAMTLSGKRRDDQAGPLISPRSVGEALENLIHHLTSEVLLRG